MQKYSNQKHKNLIRVTQFYVILIIISVIIMIIAAYVTYGYDGYIGHISFGTKKVKKQINTKKNLQNKLKIGVDFSKVPSDKIIEDILNNTIPNVCKYNHATDKIKKKCRRKPLSCLKSYKINKILVKDVKYQDQLFIDLLTGKKDQKKYTIVIDLLNNNQILNKGGKIDKKQCRKLKKTAEESHLINNDPSITIEGDDPSSSGYVQTKKNK